MKAVIAIDSFKGSLTSLEAGEAAAEGVRRVFPQGEVVVSPLADGGEGTTQALVQALGGRLEQVTVTGPLEEKVEGEYGICGSLAVIEMAAAAGLPLVPPDKRNPLKATTRGVGEMILDALEKGCRRFLVGIGGSATNDGGVGMLQALGFRFDDREGKPVPAGARGLAALASVDGSGADPRLKDCRFRVACDVNNPLCGPRGCSAVYGPQKGADPQMVSQMDRWLEAYSRLAEAAGFPAHPDQPGAGAAGGLGFAFRTFLEGELESGIGIVLEETGLAQKLQGADLTITGEGRLDGQTAMGKAPVGVARLAREQGCRTVLAVAGSVTDQARACNQEGIDAFFPILPGILTLEEAMEPQTARRNLANTVEQAVRLWRQGREAGSR